MDVHGQPFCVSSALCRLCQFWFRDGESVTADLRDTKARNLVSFPFAQNGTHVDGHVTIHIACTKRGCWCQPGILCFHTSCYAFYSAKFGQTSHLLVDSMYSDYTPAFSLQRKRTAYILSLLERRTTSGALATLPPELRRLVARDLVREYAVVNLHHLVHTAPTVPNTVTIDLEQDVYASYVRIEGSTYVQSLHNKAPQGARLDCKHIHSPHPGQIVRKIFLEYDHLGIRGVHVCAPRSDSQQTADNVWWVELRRQQGLRHILAVSDGLKVRGIMDGMEQDVTDGSIRGPAWPEPATECKVIDLEGLKISTFPPRGLRMSHVEFNAPHVQGYFIAIFRRQVIKLQAHRQTASRHFYHDADIICRDLTWIYMPVDPGDSSLTAAEQRFWERYPVLGIPIPESMRLELHRQKYTLTK
ncbi:Protein kinase-like protein [Metarhizium brunneum]